MKRGAGMSNGAYCSEHSGLVTKVAHIEKQTDINTSDIKTVGDAVIRLTVILERMQQEQDARPAPQPIAPKAPFMDNETKKLLIKWGFTLIIVLIIALTGANIIERLQALSGVK